MSVDGYLGPKRPRLEKKPGECLEPRPTPGFTVGGVPVPRGVDYPESVEQMLRPLTEPQPLGFRRRKDEQAEIYESVEAYDPVLWWHCRL